MSNDQVMFNMPKDWAQETVQTMAGIDEDERQLIASSIFQGPMLAMIVSDQLPSQIQARRSFGYFLEEVIETLEAVGAEDSTSVESLKAGANFLKRGEESILNAGSKQKLIDGVLDTVWTGIAFLYAALGEEGAQEAMRRLCVANAKKFPNGVAIIDPVTKKFKKPEDWEEPRFEDIPCVDLT